MSLVVGVPKESAKGENRVAIDPATARKIASSGYEVVVEKDAGKCAFFPDKQYTEIEGVSVSAAASRVWKSDLVIKIQPPTSKEVTALKKGASLISYIYSHQRMPLIKQLAQKRISVLAMELIPRITRAQSMDTLSSQAAIAGYKAVLSAADLAPVFFPMLTYAAGSVRPARVLVIGTGVAGLQAIATARRLGAQVEAYDVRPETREQVESLGAKFVHIDIEASGSGGYARELTKEELKIQQDTLARHIANSSVVITTAAVPGRPAPKIVSKSMVEGMATGSVIIDLGAEGGGNVAITKAGKIVEHKGVRIAGLTNVASDMPIHASEMYSKNIYNLLVELLDNGKINLDMDDEIVAGCLLSTGGKLIHPTLAKQTTAKKTTAKKKAAPGLAKAAKPAKAANAVKPTKATPSQIKKTTVSKKKPAAKTAKKTTVTKQKT